MAATFFRVFSRTEYALKTAGFNNGEGEAQPNWKKFADSVEELFANPESPELKQAIDFMLCAPPKKQMIVDGKMEWQECEPKTNSSADKLLIYVRRIRNNLFHGGKFNDHWFEPERSEPLLRHSLTILYAVKEKVPEVKEAYDG